MTDQLSLLPDLKPVEKPKPEIEKYDVDLPIDDEKMPPVMIEIKDIVTNGIVKFMGVKPARADHIAHHVACEMAQHFGGEKIYIPRNKSHNKHSRDLEMYRQFNGHNYRALAKKYGMAREHVYRVISDIRAQKKQEIKNLRSKGQKTPKDKNSEPR